MIRVDGWAADEMIIKEGVYPNITQPKGLNSGAEFNAAPKRLHGGSDASSGGSIFLALAISAP